MVAFTWTENVNAYRAILSTALEEVPELATKVATVVSDFSTSIRKAVVESLPAARRVLCGFHYDLYDSFPFPMLCTYRFFTVIVLVSGT